MNSVTTLGTLHDLFLSNPKYGVSDFTSAIVQFKPDMIFSEVRVGFPTVRDACIDGGIEQAIIYAYAEEHKIPVVATDWFTEEFVNEMMSEGASLDPSTEAQLSGMMRQYQASFFSDSLLDLHSSNSQARIRGIYQRYEAVGLMASRKRNERILANIKSRLSSLMGARILIVYGMDHKYFIDDHLSNCARVLDVASWFDQTIATNHKISSSTKSKILENLKTSKSELSERLNSQAYSEFFAKRLKAKLPRFDDWIAHFEKI